MKLKTKQISSVGNRELQNQDWKHNYRKISESLTVPIRSLLTLQNLQCKVPSWRDQWCQRQQQNQEVCSSWIRFDGSGNLINKRTEGTHHVTFAVLARITFLLVILDRCEQQNKKCKVKVEGKPTGVMCDRNIPTKYTSVGERLEGRN